VPQLANEDGDEDEDDDDHAHGHDHRHQHGRPGFVVAEQSVSPPPAAVVAGSLPAQRSEADVAHSFATTSINDPVRKSDSVV
jgi:ABC-type Zn2+ transport system substrate-binding protein/surface adhesin